MKLSKKWQAENLLGLQEDLQWSVKDEEGSFRVLLPLFFEGYIS
jgi:hypothetical protein